MFRTHAESSAVSIKKKLKFFFPTIADISASRKRNTNHYFPNSETRIALQLLVENSSKYAQL